MGSSQSAECCRLPHLLPGRRIAQQFCQEGTFHDHLAKRADPSRLSDRAKRDEELKPEIERVFEENLSVYGVRKVWHQMRREGFDTARCTVARLMKDIGIEGVIRGK